MLMDMENNIETKGKPSRLLTKQGHSRQILGTISNGLADNNSTNKDRATVKSKSDICKLKEKIQLDPDDDKLADFQQKSDFKINNNYGRNIGNYFKLMMISSNKNALKMLSDAIKEFGIDYIINFTDENGDSLCSLACANGQLDIIRYLVVEMGVNILQVSSSQKHPLHVACSHGQINVVRFLCLILSTNPDIRDKNGNTPLHVASTHGYLDIVRFLIEKMDTLSVLLLNQDDETPITLAEKNHHHHITEYLNQIKDSVIQKHEMMTNNSINENNNNNLINGEEEESYYSFTTDITERSELENDDDNGNGNDHDQGESGRRLHTTDEMTTTFVRKSNTSRSEYEGAADDSLGMIIYDLHDELKLMMTDSSCCSLTLNGESTSPPQLASLSYSNCRDHSQSEKDIEQEVYFNEGSATSTPNSLTVHGAHSNDSSLRESSQLSEALEETEEEEKEDENLEEELKGLLEDQRIPLQQLLPYSSYANSLLSEFFSDSTVYYGSDMSDLTNTSIDRKVDEVEEDNDASNSSVNLCAETSLVVQEVDQTRDTTVDGQSSTEIRDDFPIIPGGRTGRVTYDEDDERDQDVLNALKLHLRNSLIEMDIYVQQKYSNFSEQSVISDAVDGLPLLHTSTSSESTSSSAITPKTNRSLKDLSFGSKASVREGFHRPKILSPILSPMSLSTDDCQLSPEPSTSLLQEDWNSFSLDQHIAQSMADSPLSTSISGNVKYDSVNSAIELEDSFQANCIIS